MRDFPSKELLKALIFKEKSQNQVAKIGPGGQKSIKTPLFIYQQSNSPLNFMGNGYTCCTSPVVDESCLNIKEYQ
jgi:hypothetical protein